MKPRIHRLPGIALLATTPAGVAANHEERPARIRVWDVPVHVFHWLAVVMFAGAYLTAESERWRLAHVSLGYTLAGLVVFRLVWGVLGTRHARFTSFVRGPAAVKRYLLSMLRGQPEHHTGHNPAGALAMLALVGVHVAAVLAFGWLQWRDAPAGGMFPAAAGQGPQHAGQHAERDGHDENDDKD